MIVLSNTKPHLRNSMQITIWLIKDMVFQEKTMLITQSNFLKNMIKIWKNRFLIKQCYLREKVKNSLYCYVARCNWVNRCLILWVILINKILLLNLMTNYLNLVEVKNLNIDVKHTGADSLWQNGLCERNHVVIDSIVTCMTKDNKNLSLHWYVQFMQKNCLDKNSG